MDEVRWSYSADEWVQVCAFGFDLPEACDWVDERLDPEP